MSNVERPLVGGPLGVSCARSGSENETARAVGGSGQIAAIATVGSDDRY